MNTRDLTPAATHLRKGEILRLHDGRGQRIESVLMRYPGRSAGSGRTTVFARR